MNMNDVDEFYLSVTSSLNPYHTCESLFFEKQIIKSPLLVPQQKVYFGMGGDVHNVEEEFWKATIKHGKKAMRLLAHSDVTEIHDMLMSYKEILIGSHYQNVYEYASNLLWIDAQRFVDLMEHFDGDFEQSYEFWVPIGLEYEYVNHDTKTKVKIDRLHKIPARYKNYRNTKIALGIFDMKPGKVGKTIKSNSEYDKSYGGDFNRQLAFYADNLEYKLGDVENVVDRFTVGLYYRNRQMVVDKLDGRSYGALRKLVTRFWDTEVFNRRVHNDWKYDKCVMCEYRGTCRNTPELWKGEGKPAVLDDYLVEKTCKCGKKFYNLKRHDEIKICNECKVKSEKK